MTLSCGQWTFSHFLKIATSFECNNLAKPHIIYEVNQSYQVGLLKPKYYTETKKFVDFSSIKTNCNLKKLQPASFLLKAENKLL